VRPDGLSLTLRKSSEELRYRPRRTGGRARAVRARCHCSSRGLSGRRRRSPSALCSGSTCGSSGLVLADYRAYIDCHERAGRLGPISTSRQRYASAERVYPPRRPIHIGYPTAHLLQGALQRRSDRAAGGRWLRASQAPGVHNPHAKIGPLGPLRRPGTRSCLTRE
jgi:hypothetical protein